MKLYDSIITYLKGQLKARESSIRQEAKPWQKNLEMFCIGC